MLGVFKFYFIPKENIVLQRFEIDNVSYLYFDKNYMEELVLEEYFFLRMTLRIALINIILI